MASVSLTLKSEQKQLTRGQQYVYRNIDTCTATATQR